MNKRKFIIGFIVIFSLVITITLGLVGYEVVGAKKVNSTIDLGIKYLMEGSYEEAALQFSKVIEIDNKNEKALELLELTNECIELERLYLEKEYILASELISTIKENKYLEYVQVNVNDIFNLCHEKIVIINEINDIDKKIEDLTNENKYEEAINLIDKYLLEDLNDEYLEKLNQLIANVNEAESRYEEEQAKLEEERKKQEEANRELTEVEARQILLEYFEKDSIEAGIPEGTLITKDGKKYWKFLCTWTVNPVSYRVAQHIFIVDVKDGTYVMDDSLAPWNLN